MGGREGCALLLLAISCLEGNEINQQQLDTLSAAAESRSSILGHDHVSLTMCSSESIRFRPSIREDTVEAV